MNENNFLGSLQLKLFEGMTTKTSLIAEGLGRFLLNFSILFLSIVFFFSVSMRISYADHRNLIANSSFEKANGNIPAYWSKGQWGNLNAVFEYPVVGRGGRSAAKVAVSAFASGDAKWYFRDVSVSPGKEYVFSDWSNSSVDTRVVARFHFRDGSDKYVPLGAMAGTGEWKEFKVKLAIPVGVVSMTVFHVLGGNGFLMVDDYVLREAGVDPKFPEGMISFAFDDGFRSVFVKALPILNKAGIKSTQAVIAGEIMEAYGNQVYATKDQVMEMARKGHEIASHAKMHIALSTLPASRARIEIAGSKKDLATLGIKTASFVYPYDSYNDEIINIVKGAGYIGARSSDEGYNTPSSNPYHLLSRNVNSNVTIETIKKWIDTAVAEKLWLVLVFHHQGKIPGNLYSNDPATLQWIVDYVKRRNLKTVTLSQGLEMLE